MTRPARNTCCSARTFVLALLSLAGCATFTSYPSQMQSSLDAFEQGNLESAFSKVQKENSSALLPLLEAGMILHCEGKPEESNETFQRAEAVVRNYQEKAVISLSQGTAQVGSLLVNEKTLPYQGEPFERVMVNTIKAVNYLFLRQYEEARVEIRRSFAVQEKNREIHGKAIANLEETASQRGIQSDRMMSEVDPYYRDAQQIAARVANPYEDPFAYYLSAMVYELNGEYNDAFIDLKRVQELVPGLSCVENDLLRMAKMAGMGDSLTEWSRKLARQPRLLDPKKEGELVLLFECGMGPRKDQIMIPLPIPEVGLLAVAFPRYQQVPNRIQTAAVYDDGHNLVGRSQTLTDVDGIAFRNLEDQMPILVLKQALRAAAKGAVAATATDQVGLAGMLLTSAYNLITEQADLRSWLTLPQSFQVARIPLAQGSRSLQVAFTDSTGHPLQELPVNVEVKAGEIYFLHLRTGSQGLIASTLYPPEGQSLAAP